MINSKKKSGNMFRGFDIVCGVGCWFVALVSNNYYYYNEFKFISIPMAILGLPVIWLILFALTLFPKRRPRLRLWWVWLSAPVVLHVKLIVLFLLVFLSKFGYHP
jgi:hypothetical protein